MKPMPFLRVPLGGIFNDIDGTTFLKTTKVYFKKETDYQEINCIVLIPNKPKDQRGTIRTKEDDVYCEVLDKAEIADLVLNDENEIIENTDHQ